MKRNSLIIAALAVAILLPRNLTAAEKPGPGTFTFTVLEIPDIQRGAGLAIVMRTPSGKTWLYDTGTAHPEPASSDGWLANFNAGRDVVAPFIASVFPRFARGLKSTPTLEELGARTYITGLNGDITVTTDGKTYQVTAERNDE